MLRLSFLCFSFMTPLVMSLSEWVCDNDPSLRCSPRLSLCGVGSGFSQFKKKRIYNTDGSVLPVLVQLPQLWSFPLTTNSFRTLIPCEIYTFSPGLSLLSRSDSFLPWSFTSVSWQPHHLELLKADHLKQDGLLNLKPSDDGQASPFAFQYLSTAAVYHGLCRSLEE